MDYMNIAMLILMSISTLAILGQIGISIHQHYVLGTTSYKVVLEKPEGEKVELKITKHHQPLSQTLKKFLKHISR